jgi:hypothetical protein
MKVRWWEENESAGPAVNSWTSSDPSVSLALDEVMLGK